MSRSACLPYMFGADEVLGSGWILSEEKQLCQELLTAQSSLLHKGWSGSELDLEACFIYLLQLHSDLRGAHGGHQPCWEHMLSWHGHALLLEDYVLGDI